MLRLQIGVMIKGILTFWVGNFNLGRKAFIITHFWCFCFLTGYDGVLCQMIHFFWDFSIPLLLFHDTCLLSSDLLPSSLLQSQICLFFFTFFLFQFITRLSHASMGQVCCISIYSAFDCLVSHLCFSYFPYIAYLHQFIILSIHLNDLLCII